MVDFDRLTSAYRTARQQLLDNRCAAGHWEGRLSSSALSTATAVSALALVRRHVERDDSPAAIERQQRLGELIFAGLDWLVHAQNADGGWGDTDRSLSNIATTMLVRAAFQLTCVPAADADLLKRADNYIRAQGGVAGLRRRYGRDKTFAVPILTNCALAGLVSWKEVSPLPFELACFPQSWFRFLRLPVVSYAIPALVAIGQARFFHRKPLNPLVRLWRGAALEKSLCVLEQLQPSSGGFLEATPLTSFVVMSLASFGQARHPVARKGLDFIVNSVREDGSWPIDTNLATWVTTLSLNALSQADDESAAEAGQQCRRWLLDCQGREVHPYTGAAPGGWGWSDLSGSVPDADDTPGALLALAGMVPVERRRVGQDRVAIAGPPKTVGGPAPAKASLSHPTFQPSRDERGSDVEQISEAASQGIRWLLDLQNSDGGWPTFCRGWGKLPFDRSGTDLTAHVLRALNVWRTTMDQAEITAAQRAIKTGFEYLAVKQHADGSWSPLWFGDQHHPREENPLYGTARVLLAYAELRRMDDPAACRGLAWLASQQRADGAWGAEPSVEETALAVEALLATGDSAAYHQAVQRGLNWLIEAVETGRFRQASPIGFYFAKLWYYETLYPVIFTVAALGRAVRLFEPVAGGCRLDRAPSRYEPTLVEPSPAH